MNRRQLIAEHSGLALHMEEVWRKCAPKLVASLEEAGTLYETIANACQDHDRLFNQLLSQGNTPVEALSEANREYLYESDPEEPEPESPMQEVIDADMWHPIEEL